MYDRDELCSELCLHIMGNMFNGEGNGIPGCERRVYNHTKVFDLEVSLVQDFKGTSIIEVMIKGDGKVRVYDDSDEGRVFGRGQEQAEVVAID